MKKSVLAVMTALVGIGMPAMAQNHPNVPEKGEILYVVGDATPVDTAQGSVYRVLVMNAPVTNQFMDIPRFSIIGKDRKFYLSIGGSMKATASVDWGNPLNNPSGFTVSSISPVGAGNGAQILGTVRKSGLHFNFVALPHTDNQVGFYISLHFSGGAPGSYICNLNNAYAKYRGFTLGYTSSFFTDGAAIPYTIDSEGPVASQSNSNFLIGFDKTYNNGLGIGVSAEMPYVSYTVNSNSQQVNQRIPDVPAYIQYQFSKGNRVRLTGLFRGITYRDNVKNENHTAIGYGAHLSGNFSPNPFVIYYSGYVGKGIASHIQGLNSLGLDLTPNANVPGELKASTTWGASVAAQLNITSKLFATAGYSYIRNYADSYTGNSDYATNYKYGQYAFGNIIWQPLPFFTTGIEYIHGQKNCFDGSSCCDNRIMAMATFSL